MPRRVLMVLALALAPLSGGAEVVGNLKPEGDNYLSLRQRPSTSAPELSRMGPGTVLTILQSDGPWRRVRTADGREGWAHSRYILPGGAPATPPANAPAAPRVLAPTASGPAAAPVPAPVADEFDWLVGHLLRYHNPTAYFP